MQQAPARPQQPSVQAQPRQMGIPAPPRQANVPAQPRSGLRVVGPNMGAAPRISSAPGQRFFPQQNAMGARMGAVPLTGGYGQRHPFLGSVRMGQEGQVPPGVQNGEIPPAQDRPTRESGPAQQALERRKAWGQLKRLEAEELAAYLDGIATRMEELRIPSGIVRKYRDKLQQFASTAAPDAELALSDDEIIELNEAILVYEEAEQKTDKTLAYVAGAVTVVGIGVVIALVA